MFKHANNVVLGIDVGGSHISSALVNFKGEVLVETLCKNMVNTQVKNPVIIIDQWVQTMKETLSHLHEKELRGIGVAMPGPFDYENGISLLNGVGKYESLYGMSIKEAISSRLNLPANFPLLFRNDADCFGLGEAMAGEGVPYKNIIAITLGTGFGAAFIKEKKLVKEGNIVPEKGYLYNVPYKEGIAEDYVSSRWLMKNYLGLSISATKTSEVKEIANAAIMHNDSFAKEVFEIYGKNIAHCLAPWIKSFNAECIILGGSICKSSGLFLPSLIAELRSHYDIDVHVAISRKMELSAIAGAAHLIEA